MSVNAFVKEFDMGGGRMVSIETGKLAKQADGSVVVKYGNTMLLCTAVSNTTLREGQSFFPLSVDFQEKYAGAGRIPGNFFRREGRLGAMEILNSRLVDRAIRPLFPDGYMYETQILIYVISGDADVNADAFAALAASAALTVSDIPFAGPISEARVGRINGEFKVNPLKSEMVDADMDIMVGATMDNVTMVEGEMKEVSEEDLAEAIKVAHEAIKIQCQAQIEMAEALNITKREFVLEQHENDELVKKIKDFCSDKIEKVAKSGLAKHDRKAQFTQIKEDLKESLGELEEEDAGLVKETLYKLEKEIIREMMLADKVRLDGRKPDQVRDLWMEIDYLPSAHGSAVFTRGETQCLATVTLGTKLDELRIDTAFHQGFSKFMLHYNFPPFSTGEAKPIRGTGRREVGHGNLAERSLKQVLPAEADNPYTVRIVSDVLESNGSSSMATVCAGSLALMDSGLPVTAGVSGIAMGLISDGERFTVLSDILGDEDHLGDMDFKVTGTMKGIVACQMDIKIDGLPYEILNQALQQAKEGREGILSQMNDCIDKAKAEYKPHTPRIEKLYVDNEFIGAIIGPGGKIIQEMQKETNTIINIVEMEDGRGEVTIASNDKAGTDLALARIKGITATAEEGMEYDATVKAIQPYGAFVEFLPGKEGLLHISEISWSRLETMDDVFEVGEQIKVKLVGIDKRSGKYKLSRKVLLPKPEAS